MYALDTELCALRQTFFEEAEERLLTLEQLLLELERDPHDSERLHAIFRAVHSLKGGSGACEFDELATFAHVVESLLSPLRKGLLSVNARRLTVLLHANDVLTAMVDDAKRGVHRGRGAAADDVVAAIRQELSELSVEGTEPVAAPIDLSAGFAIWSDPPPAPSAPPDARPSVVSARVLASDPWPSDFPGSSRHSGMQARTPTATQGDSVVLALGAATHSIHTPNAAETGEEPPGPRGERRGGGGGGGDDGGGGPHRGADPQADDEGEAGAGCALLHDQELRQLIELSMQISACSAELQHMVESSANVGSLRDATLAQLERLEPWLMEFETHLNELRGGSSSSVVDGVMVACGEQTYVLRTASVASYVQLQWDNVRVIASCGRVLSTAWGMLPLLSLARLLGAGDDAAEAAKGIALIARIRGRHAALLVDEVVAQGKLLVRSLEQNYRKVPGVDGATPCGEGLALLLNLDELTTPLASPQAIQMR